MTPSKASGRLDPQILPDGKHVIFSALNFRGKNDASSCCPWKRVNGVFSFEEVAIFAKHATSLPGHIIYSERGGLMAAAIDHAELKVIGAPISVIENVYTLDPWPTAYFTVSDTGSIVYVPRHRNVFDTGVDRSRGTRDAIDGCRRLGNPSHFTRWRTGSGLGR